MTTITKAIIPVAGWGTRRLPIAKTVEKCMLPIGNRPLVDYVVQDCIKAGVTDIYFVISEGSSQLQDYYSENKALNDYLKNKGKEGSIPNTHPSTVKMHYITQDATAKYGTAVPVALTAKYVQPGESVVVLMGDDFFYNADGSSEVERLIKNTPKGENGILGAVLTERDTLIGRYGLIEVGENDRFERVVEHPDVMPDPFIKNVSKYLLTYPMLQAIERYVERDDVQGEYYIFTPFNDLLESGQEKMTLVRAEGRYLDGGTLETWLQANQVVCG